MSPSFCCLPSPAPADTIRLKNGSGIYADRVHENNGRVEYEIGDNSYAIPKTMVDTVEGGGVPSPSPLLAHHNDDKVLLSDIPALSAERPRAANDLNSRIIPDGEVDQEELSAVESKGDALIAAIAYDIAGEFEQEHGKSERAAT